MWVSRLSVCINKLEYAYSHNAALHFIIMWKLWCCTFRCARSLQRLQNISRRSAVWCAVALWRRAKHPLKRMQGSLRAVHDLIFNSLSLSYSPFHLFSFLFLPFPYLLVTCPLFRYQGCEIVPMWSIQLRSILNGFNLQNDHVVAFYSICDSFVVILRWWYEWIWTLVSSLTVWVVLYTIRWIE